MTWLRASCGLAAVVLAMTGVAACTGEPQSQNEAPPVIVPGGPGEPAKTLPRGQATPPPAMPPNEADTGFMGRMIVHHQQAIEMTALVPDRGASDVVRRLADRIADSQRPEIDVMKSWLRSHGHDEHGAHQSTMPGMATGSQLDALRAATGADFDTLFLRLMITHHEGALTMAREVQTSGVDVRVQELADEVIAVQSAEINRMRGLLRS